MAIDLYIHPLSPPSNAVRTLVRILGLKVNEIIVDFMQGKQLEPEFLKVSF